MRKSLVFATFVVVGAGAAGAGALTGLNMLGSDTLFDVTNQVLTTCSIPANNGTNGITYLGTGSGNGESNMQATAFNTPSPGVNNQTVAPMSRFLQTAPCNVPVSGGVAGSDAEGLVVGLDGVAVVANGSGAAACNGSAVGCAIDPQNGLAFNTTLTLTTAYTSPGLEPGFSGITSYTFQDWRDVLRIVYGGVDNKAGNGSGNVTLPNGTVASSVVNAYINCNSTLRQQLVNHWGQLFENACSSGAGCTQLEHVFRRDDGSGTSDVFATLLNLGSVNESKFQDPYCNAVQPQGYTGKVGTTTVTVTPAGAAGLLPPGSSCAVVAASGGTQPTSGCELLDNMNYQDYQDNDPIRRTCVGTGKPLTLSDGTCGPSKSTGEEQVCGRDGDLGLVVSIVPTDFLGLGNQYPTQTCTPGVFLNAPNPITIANATASNPPTAPLGSVVLRAGYCPNGDVPAFGTTCKVPADNGSNPCTLAAGDHPAAGAFCLNYKQNIPGFIVGSNLPDTRAKTPSQADGRVYNEHLYLAPGQTNLGVNGGAAQTASATPFADAPGTFDTFYATDTLKSINKPNRQIQGAFYRIHTTRSLVGPDFSNVTCTQKDATDQIGCLVGASPCSIGYAGREASTIVSGSGAQQQTALALKVNGVSPESPACIANFQYPISRKLYFNTIVGFPNVSGDERTLTSCEANVADIDPALTAFGFVNFNQADAFLQINAGAPYCEDYNEALLCGAASNNNACAGNAAVGLPTVSTTCGDGIVQAYEDCDNGSANGTSGNLCSKTCRFNQGTTTINAAGCLVDVATGNTCLPAPSAGGGPVVATQCVSGGTQGTCVQTGSGCACNTGATQRTTDGCIVDTATGATCQVAGSPCIKSGGGVGACTQISGACSCQ